MSAGFEPRITFSVVGAALAQVRRSFHYPAPCILLSEICASAPQPERIPNHIHTAPKYHTYVGLTWRRPLLLRLSLRFTFLIISMSSTREQIATRRKRQRTEADLPLDDPSELQPSKRLKSRTKLHSVAFYDSLSKVWLTRRALKELDRRTSQANSPQRPASTPRRVTRNTSKQIRRFARDGGPELRDLRGVRPNCQSV